MKKCLQIYKAKFGWNDSRTADVLVTVGRMEGRRGEEDAQLASFEEALKILQDNDLGSPRNIAGLLNECGRIDEARGDREKAIEVYTAALRTRDMGSGEEEACQEYDDSLHSISFLYAKKGHLSVGLKHFKESLRIKNALRKDPSKSTAETMWDVGIWQEVIGDIDGATSSLERTLEVEMALYGKDHTHVAQTVLRLANIFEGRGQADEALGYYKDALRIKRLLDRDSSELADALTSIGYIRMHRRDMGGMNAVFSEVVKIAAQTGSVGSELTLPADADNLRWYDIKYLFPDAACAA